MPAALYLPRRHRRHLLFPPGLLALAGLLWLGCGAVPRIVGPTQHVMEVVFFNQHTPASFPSLLRMKELGPWQSITLSNDPWTDYFDMKIVENASLSLAKEQSQHRALHVYLDESTSYSTLIQLWDMCNRLGIKRYWVDWRKLPFSFNLLGNTPPEPDQLLPEYDTPVLLSCGTSDMIESPALQLDSTKSFSEIAGEWLTESWAAIRSPTWRNTTLLLLFLTALSAWKLRRQWRAVAS